VLEVPRDDDLLRLRPVEHGPEPVQRHAALEPRDRDALLRERALEAEVEIGDDEGPFVPEEEGEVPCRLDALRDLEPVHDRRIDARPG